MPLSTHHIRSLVPRGGRSLSSCTSRFRFWCLVLGASLTVSLAGCASRSAPQETQSPDPRATPESLALSYLKAADVELALQTMESARNAVKYSTEALGWAPPRSRIRRWLVARMLLTRARAQTELGRPDSALVDLEAALLWAKQDQQAPTLLFAEIHLAEANALLRLKKTDQAQEQVATALARARGLGKSGAGLLCDALILEGDIAVRLGSTDHPAPLSYYREVFTVAARYDYPEDTWPHLDRALARLEITDEAERARLMGPVEARRAELEADVARQKGAVSYNGRQEASGLANVSSGSVPGAAETVSELHNDGFRRCYQQALSDNPEASGSIRLTISIGSNGQVDNVTETHNGLSESIVACVLEVAQGAQFARPESTSAVVVVPVNFVRQYD